jgi:PAS domain S-box-containing protein
LPYRLFTKQGKIRWVDDRTYIRRNEKGDITHFQGIIMDITERKLAEVALHESENRFRQLAERLDDAVWLWALSDPIQVLYCNPAFEKIWGVGPKEVNRDPRNAMKNVPIEDQEKINADFAAFQQGKQEFSLEHRIVKNDGTIRWVWARAYGVYNEEGEMFRAVGIAHDITQSKLAMEKIQSLLNEKEILLKEVHHRIKNNMNTLQSLLTLQISRLKDNEAVAALDAAKSRMATMMLLYEKLYQSKTIQEVSTQDFLISLIDEMASTYSVDVHITKKIEEVTIPASTASSLGIIIYELISNAMKYAFTNGKNNQLSIGLSVIENRLSIIVEDNGIGYNPDGEKTGFGLELVSSLLESMDGTFTIENDNGTRCLLEFAAK